MSSWCNRAANAGRERMAPRNGSPMQTIRWGATVLFFLIAGSALAFAEASLGTTPRLFEFSTTYQTGMGPGGFDGLMASDGSRCRIAVFWTEPAILRESQRYLGYSDFIFMDGAVYYWMDGMPKHEVFHVAEQKNTSLLPMQDSLDSALRSALALVSNIESVNAPNDIALEVGKFFHNARDRTQYTYRASNDRAKGGTLSKDSLSDVQVLNQMPFGREYVKERRDNGTLLWRMQKALNGRPVIHVAVRPVADEIATIHHPHFDPETLGQWTLIGESYRAYWSYAQVLSRLPSSTDGQSASLDLYERIDAYLRRNTIPSDARRALNHLRFRVALETGMKSPISQSIQAVITGLCRNKSVSKYRCFLELAEYDGEIRHEDRQLADELLPPLAELVVDHAGKEAMANLERLAATLRRNKWLPFGEKLLQEIQQQGLVEEEAAARLAVKLRAMRLARERNSTDPVKVTSTVNQYLEQMDSDPRPGRIDMDDLRDILDRGLTKETVPGQAGAMYVSRERVIELIRRMVGDGPFSGDPEKLAKSVARFSSLYRVICQTKEPIEPPLAIFLALSFFDVSTQSDHEELMLQYRQTAALFRAQVDALLSERNLGTLVTSEEVKAIFHRHEKVYFSYVDDPLWPTLKYPFTNNEKTRLVNKLKLRFARLTEPLNDVAVNTKYGGENAAFKKKAHTAISFVVEEILAEAAFLRIPPYRGIASVHRGGYGLSIIIEEHVVKTDRPKETFKAMMYFHLGDHLLQITKREARIAQQGLDEKSLSKRKIQ